MIRIEVSNFLPCYGITLPTF